MNDLTIVFELTLSLGVIAACIVGYILLVISKNGNLLLNRLLIFMTVPICLFYILIGYSQDHPNADLTFLLRTFFPLHYIVSPLFFLYFRTFIQDDTRLSKKDFVHLLPLGLHLLYISPLFIDIIKGDVTWNHLLLSGQGPDKQFAFGPIPNKVHSIMRITVSSFYIGLMWKHYLGSSFSEFIARNKDLYPYATRWIKYYLLVATLLGITGVLLKAQFLIPGMEPVNNHDSLLTWIITFSFLGMLLYLIMNPIVLFGLPHFSQSGVGNLIVKKDEKTPTSPPILIPAHPENSSPVSSDFNFLRLRISPKYLQGHYPNGSEHQKILLLIDRIERYVDDQKPFTKSNWNLDVLSREIKVPKHHLLFIFSQVLHYSFVDYRNELRVKHAQQTLQKGIIESKTIESIGLDSGFPSRATFFSVFKKQTGISPGQYAENNGLANV